MQEGILFLGPKKQCIRRNQSNLQDKTLFSMGNEIVYQKKSKQRARENQTFKEQEKECQNQSKKGQEKIHMFLNVRELRSNK